jgi:hypothetical protein
MVLSGSLVDAWFVELLHVIEVAESFLLCRIFKWFCEAVCSGEFIHLLTYFTSEAWFYLDDHSQTHNSRRCSVYKPKEPYGVSQCHTEFWVCRAIIKLSQEYSGSSSFRAQQIQKAALDKLSAIYWKFKWQSEGRRVLKARRCNHSHSHILHCHLMWYF